MHSEQLIHNKMEKTHLTETEIKDCAFKVKSIEPEIQAAIQVVHKLF